jgi:myo-inositol-1-phosphate synthase
VSNPIRVGLIGIGNCASAFVQALEYYRTTQTDDGLLHPRVGKYSVADIAICCAFDIDKRKVGLDLAAAIYAAPNNCRQICADIPKTRITVQMGPILDGVPPHLRKLVEPSSDPAADVTVALREAQADVVVNMLPTGSSKAARHYAEAALEAGSAIINGMPARIARNPDFAARAAQAGVPVIGDDVKSQFGATIAHRTLLSAMVARGIQVDRTHQLNYAGNTDFVNLVRRGESKKVTKTAAIESVVPYDIDASAGFAYLPSMGDRKTADIFVEGRTFGSVPVRLHLTLEVEDSANFGGVIVDAIRSCQIARDRGIGGVLDSASAFLMKDPPASADDVEALQNFRAFMKGDRQR